MVYPFTESTRTNMETTDNTYQETFDVEQEEAILWPWFERIYFFVMLIYAAQMTQDTARMVGNLSGNPIPFLIPILLTIILLFRNPISFADKRLWALLGITGLWSISSIVKYNAFSNQELSYHFFLYYAIIIAYIHIKVYDTDLMTLYEKTMVTMCKITLPLWLLCVIAPLITHQFFTAFPETGFGNNFLYIFNYMDPSKGQEFRNAGFSWEPGRFAIMIALAIYCNLLQNGIDIRSKRLWILLAAMASTMSTTGYSVTFIILLLFYIKNLSLGKGMLLTIIIVPLATYVYSLDFMGDKIGAQIDKASNTSSLDFKYTNKKHNDGEYAFSLDRFPSMIFEWENIKKDPILGYSRNHDHSFFYQNVSKNVVLTGGLLKSIGEFGIIFALFIYFALIKSSRKEAQLFGNGSDMTLFFTLIVCSVSYPVFGIPIFTAFWFNGLFCNDEDEYILEGENYIENEYSPEAISK